MDETGDVDGATLIACRETSEMLKAAEAWFYAVALFVDDPVMGDDDLATAV